MKAIKRIIVLLILGCIGNTWAQVGINTTNPYSMFQVQSSNQATPAPTDGLLIPKVDAFPLTNPTVNQDGMLVYLTTVQGSSQPGFYFWKNITNTWVAILNDSNSGTLDNAYDFGGAGNGRSITADSGAVTILGNDGLAITGGTVSAGALLPSGAGVKMVWNPRKAAFRAGFVNSAQWNDASSGFYSSAFGANTLASGNYSMACNYATNATGFESAAFGEGTNASGTQSAAFGYFSNASGTRATAFGSQNNASFTNAFAFGQSNTANNLEATAFGFQTLATGMRATAFGWNTTATQNNCTAFGYYCNATATEATSFGYYTSASNTRATSFGANTIASGPEATAFGFATTASNSRSTAFGSNNVASGNDATAFGLLSYATGSESTAFGTYSTASGNSSTAFGAGSLARSYGETTIGTFSVDYAPWSTGAWVWYDRIFTIGNGVNAGSRSNAMIVYKNGLAVLPSVYNGLIDSDSGKAIITKEWFSANKWFGLAEAYNYGGSGGGRFINANSGSVEIYGGGGLNVTGTGRIGIGTNNPLAPLHVVGAGAVSTGNMKFFNYAFGLLNVNPWNGFVSAYFEGTVLTRDSFVAAQTVTFSDERIKKVIGVSNRTNDLKTLNALEIVDYTMIDSLSDSKRYKKVIAQQVEKLMPDAVGKYSEYLPSIYASASETKNIDGKLSIKVPVDHKLVQGDKIKLISEINGETLATVDQTLDSRSFTVEIDKPIEGKIFVYGKKVDDFRAVDYDAISMLNVSATQELYRLLLSANQKISDLEKQKLSMAEEMDQIKKDISLLKKFALSQQQKEEKTNTIMATN